MKYITILLLSIAFVTCELPAQDSFRPLFNGTDLDGWIGNDPHNTNGGTTEHERLLRVLGQQAEFAAHWRIENGELVNDGKGPFATTVDEFGDMQLSLEYKTVAKADSGIYLRGAPQVQIWDTTEAGGKWDQNADKGSGGLYNNSKNTAGQLPLTHADRTFGEWNHMEILQLGSRTTVTFNNQLVVDNATMENYWDSSRKLPLPARGPIRLQTHGGEIRWRDIKVREIASDEANLLLRGNDEEQGFTPIFNGKDFSGWQGATADYEVVKGVVANGESAAGAFRCRPDKGGVLFTEKQYGDFVVRFEFTLPPGGNNGLAIRYPGEGDPAYVGMTELQILDGTAGQYSNLDARQFHGSAYGLVPAYRGYLRPVGQWNFQQVTVQGSTIRVELNGTIILDTDLATVDNYMAETPHPGIGRARGYFGFAGHSDPVTFRNVAIKEL